MNKRQLAKAWKQYVEETRDAWTIYTDSQRDAFLKFQKTQRYIYKTTKAKNK